MATTAPQLFPDPTAPYFRPPSAFLDDAAYATAITGLPILCSDTILVNRKRRTVYLTTRCIYPMKGLWILGGRVKRGEPELEAMIRLLKAETGHDVDPARLEFLSMNRYLWALRQQEPQDLGSDNICYTFGFEPTARELKAIEAGLSPSEYDTAAGLREFDREGLVLAGVHPVIIKLYDEVFGSQA